MAVASDAIYNGRSPVVSYVSSNAYYGYVPPCKTENELGDVLERGNGFAESTMLVPRCIYDTAMETDDDGYEYSTATRRLNNHCVIPEAALRNRFEINCRRQEQQQQHQASYDSDTLRRRNRKRCSSDLDTARELKKFREEAVVTAAFTMVQDVQRTMDWPRCVMSQHHCT